MPIICLEGASGVGKSTTSRELIKRWDAYIVPEVNELFKRPPVMPENWYFERQVERWEIAQEKSHKYEWVVLDGDVFQPLWYNWSYNFEVFGQSLEKICDFYRAHLESGTVAFPDHYFLLCVGVAELRKRKENDATRRRENFEKHLKIIEPQKRYFQEMDRRATGYVNFIEAAEVQKNVERIVAANAASLDRQNSLDLFDGMTDWLKANRA
ncbi:AAA family ATPase [Planococcus shixiaomingii]|uniref:AAA family ATPase n=1 Tax=Planococcus shixiaomingii TaxID=3058393 RepID=UPI002617AFDA|nr:AAA family ATPase [Planococcus sp. N022]WKA54989.1 AAA family ATPase [Planococcus sp. N022]